MSEFENRRKKVFDQMKDNSVAIFFSGVSKISSEDETLPFVANKNFFYLTNIKQEHSALLLIKGIGERRTYLFIDPYNLPRRAARQAEQRRPLRLLRCCVTYIRTCNRTGYPL